MERKVYFLSDSSWAGAGHRNLSKGQLPFHWRPWGKSFYREKAAEGGVRGEGGMLHAETAQSSLTVIFKLAFSGLTSAILVALKHS